MQFLSNLSKIIPTQKLLILSKILASLGFYSKVKRSKKLAKIVKIEEVKIHIF